jgi:inactivated superfamily I helicase
MAVEAILVVLAIARSSAVLAAAKALVLPADHRTYLADDMASEDARELARMRESLGPGGAVADMTVGEFRACARAPRHVVAAMIHGAKGLEFDVVIMVGADEVCLPGFTPTDDERGEAASTASSAAADPAPGPNGA